jgi:hypothetical protein
MSIIPNKLITENADIIAKAKEVESAAYALAQADKGWQLTQKSAERRDVYSDGSVVRITAARRKMNLELIAAAEARLAAALNALRS